MLVVHTFYKSGSAFLCRHGLVSIPQLTKTLHVLQTKSSVQQDKVFFIFSWREKCVRGKRFGFCHLTRSLFGFCQCVNPVQFIGTNISNFFVPKSTPNWCSYAKQMKTIMIKYTGTPNWKSHTNVAVCRLLRFHCFFATDSAIANVTSGIPKFVFSFTVFLHPLHKIIVVAT